MRILLADDHPIFLEGLRNLLLANGFDVVGTARDGLEALDQARTHRPDVIFMDISMPKLDGLAALRQIKAEMPESKVIMLTMSAADEHLFEAIRSGASGYLLKTEDTDRVFSLLRDVGSGGAVLSPGLTARILDEFGRLPGVAAPIGKSEESGKLSVREAQVLTLVAEGLTYKEVGERLFVTERTIKYHMGQIVERLHLKNRVQVVEYARRLGLGASRCSGR